MPKIYNLLALDIAEYLEQYIEQHQLKPGDKLPSERELSVLLNVTRVTLRNGLEILASQGTIFRIHGSGYYLCPPKVNRELIHYCFPYKDSLLQKQKYHLLPLEYIPEPIQNIAESVFAPVSMDLIKRHRFIEFVDNTPIGLMYTFQNRNTENLLPDFPNTKEIPNSVYFSQTICVFDESIAANESLKELLKISADDSLLLISTFICHHNDVIALCLSISVGTRVNLVSNVKLP